ncbi:hypothetical protein OOT46_21265 [Aquabacterium sp. A7-Y]|uniref:hypothetical protein n=1 Tax=Aquabacterium sp. A7-Y TaxID=1349605 RepID=UPI00223CD087|nr:hypothetical protein [Aquabacterium sp. A7-Y]MCW7540367.1 hypothetical protein [Aquabacterium sp. A7-Y]
MPSSQPTSHGTAVTPWFPSGELPHHPGVYQRQYPGGPYSCWDGTAWRNDALTPHAAARQLSSSPCQQAPWRGLLEAPSEHCMTCRGHGVVDQGDDADSGEALIEPCPDC